jgi:hypothetical protein
VHFIFHRFDIVQSSWGEEWPIMDTLIQYSNKFHHYLLGEQLHVSVHATHAGCILYIMYMYKCQFLFELSQQNDYQNQCTAYKNPSKIE